MSSTSCLSHSAIRSHKTLVSYLTLRSYQFAHLITKTVNGFVVTPLAFYLMGITISVIALIAKILVRLMRQKSLKAFPKVFKKFLWFTTSIVYQSDKISYEIYPPNLIHSIRVDRENRRYSPPVRNLKAQGYWEDNLNNLRLYMPGNQSVQQSTKSLVAFIA